MHCSSNKISTGYAVNAAFMSYLENETTLDTLQDNTNWKTFEEKYKKDYETLSGAMGKSFVMVERLLNELRAMNELECELFYRIGIRDGVAYGNGSVILQNIGGSERES